MLTTQQIAQIRGVRPVTVRYWVTTGQLPATRYGRDWLVREDDWAAFARDKKVSRAGRPRKPQSETEPEARTPDAA